MTTTLKNVFVMDTAAGRRIGRFIRGDRVSMRDALPQVPRVSETDQTAEFVAMIRKMSAIVRGILLKKAMFERGYRDGSADPLVPDDATEGEKAAAIESGLSVRELRQKNADIEARRAQNSGIQSEVSQLRQNIAKQSAPTDVAEVLKQAAELKPMDAEQLAAAISGENPNIEAFADDVSEALSAAGINPAKVIAALKAAGINPDEFAAKVRAASPNADYIRARARKGGDSKRKPVKDESWREAFKGRVFSADAIRSVIEGK